MMAWESAWFADSVCFRDTQAWRGVEAQHVVSTMRLVDTPDEQDLLEQLLEVSKPAMPVTSRPKHFLLTTPFRYNPAHSNRFRPARAKGQWYGAETVETACAEVAYWRHRFILDSVGMLDKVLLTAHTFFQAEIDGLSIDLMGNPWARAREVWVHGGDYSGTHAVAAEAQERGAQWMSYESVRAPGTRCAVVFDPNSLNEPQAGLDQSMQTWHCKATRGAVMFTRGHERFVWEF